MVQHNRTPPRDARGGVGFRGMAGDHAQIATDLAATKSSFLAHVSHELRTPLTLIAAPLEDTLAMVDLPPDARQNLLLVQRSAHRMIRMVDAMLDFSRMEAGRVDPATTKIDVAVLLRSLVESFAPTIGRAGLTLTTDIPDLPHPAQLDHDMFERIVGNLLANAVKYTPHGTITVALRDETDRFAVAISDTGTGIPPADQERVFRRFEQLAVPVGARGPEGVGIGLPMVRGLAVLLGGDVELASEVDTGSTFTVRLPYAPPDSPARNGGQRSVARREAASFVAEMSAWRGIAPDRLAPPVTEAGARLLLVEDNPDLAEYLARALSDEYDVEVAPDGLAALERIAAGRVDIVLADVRMPRGDGRSLVTAIRSDPRWADLPVILMTAHTAWGDAAEALAGGADDYLAKPFSLAELRARLAAHLGRAIDRIATSEAFEERQAHLQRALESHRVVGQAIGILVERHRLTASQAFDRLRDASQHRNVKLRDIAQRVIETGLDPDEA